MPTHLYCLLPAASEAPPADLTGIAGERVRRLVIGDVAAWVGTIEDADVSRTVQAARRHDAVVRAAMRTDLTPLPARWGQRFDDDERCAAEISARGAAISSALARVAGCVEMSVHVTTRGGHAPDAGAGGPRGVSKEATDAHMGRGRSYLEALRAKSEVEHNVQAELASTRDLLASALGELVRAEAMGATDSAGRLTLFHLVRRSDVEQYRAAADSPALRHAFGIRVGGPYAPYSFSEIRA